MENIFEVQMLLDVKVPMKDGVNLSTDIYLPKTNEKLPTVLMRTPYSNNTDEMISKAVTATRQLAKRQMTWLRSWNGVIWLEEESDNNLDIVLDTIN